MLQRKTTCSLILLLLSLSNLGCDQNNATENNLNLLKQQLGKQLFFDNNLSSPPRQSCSSCHSPNAGFADPDKDIPVSRGVFTDRFGSRNSPSVAYASFSPDFHFDNNEGIYFGGQFLDGRASQLEDQAKQPFLNAVEMANPDILSVVEKVSQSNYANDFKSIYGESIFENTSQAFADIADAIAAFERSTEVSPFSSKFDLFIDGQLTLSAQEQRGMDLFNRADKGNCAACHPSTPASPSAPVLFTDFSYDNLGVPANPNSPFLTQSIEFNPDGSAFIDFGLGGELGLVAQNGKFKVPSLRNINLTSPYMHNGVFNTLQEVVDFYSDRNASGVIPEVAENVNNDELGALGLSQQEKDDIVAFMKTLTDGYIIE